MPLTVLLLLAAIAPAQSLKDYLALRKKHGISQAVGIEALETFLGERTMEVKGIVRGTLAIDGVTVLMVERTDGETISVEAESVPDWLLGNAVPARLLIHGTRAEEFAPLEAKLIASANESSIAAIEAEAAKKAAEAAAKAKAKAAAAAKSKNGSRLSGPIGSRGKSKPAEWNLPPSEATPYYAGFIKGRNKRLSDQEAYQIAEGIVGFSIRYGVDARLILAMVMVESGFNPGATSRSGAQGLGQLMPGTSRSMGIVDPYDTHQNLYGTVRTVRGHIERYFAKTGDGYESLVLALAAYNAGSGAVRRHGGVPPYKETQNYINKVLTTYYGFIGVK